MKTITVDLGDRSYPIHIGPGALDALPGAIADTRTAGVIGLVTDENVAPLYADRVRELVEAAGRHTIICVIPAGEAHKRLAQIDRITEAFLKGGLDRSSLLLALGGGIVGDIAGFAAASYMRGIPFIQIPTTIVAQVDSSVGGKTGVNHALAKNIIGAFHQPEAVVIDTSLLESLPARELRAGLAEVIKHGVIADEALFRYMEDNVGAILEKNLDTLEYPIVRSCEIKAAIVRDDEKEHGVRANLNYGHTFGHGIEAVTDYGHFLHGEAIALGMICAGRLAVNLGLWDGATEDRQRACIEAYGLPVSWPDIPVDATLDAMKRDKKVRAGAMKFIVSDGIGHVVHRTDIAEAQARDALACLKDG